MQTNKKIYYVGIGPFTKDKKYGVFFDTSDGKTMNVGGYFFTFQEARNYLLRIQK